MRVRTAISYAYVADDKIQPLAGFLSCIPHVFSVRTHHVNASTMPRAAAFAWYGRRTARVNGDGVHERLCPDVSGSWPWRAWHVLISATPTNILVGNNKLLR